MGQTNQGPLRSVRFRTIISEGWNQQTSDLKMKDETNTLIMTDLISLSPKVYSVNHQTKDEFIQMKIKNKRTLTGLPQVVLQKEIKHDDYVNVIETNAAVKNL